MMTRKDILHNYLTPIERERFIVNINYPGSREDLDDPHLYSEHGDAIAYYSFNWASTPEGANYWYTIWSRVCGGNTIDGSLIIRKILTHKMI